MTREQFFSVCKNNRRALFLAFWLSGFFYSELFQVGFWWWNNTPMQDEYQNILLQAWVKNHPRSQMDLQAFNYATVDWNGYPYLIAKVSAKEDFLVTYDKEVKENGWQNEGENLFSTIFQGKKLYLSVRKESESTIQRRVREKHPEEIVPNIFIITISGVEKVR